MFLKFIVFGRGLHEEMLGFTPFVQAVHHRIRRQALTYQGRVATLIQRRSSSAPWIEGVVESVAEKVEGEVKNSDDKGGREQQARVET